MTGDESEAQRHVAKIMKGIGLETDVWEIDIPEVRKHPDFSMGVDRKEGLGVVGCLCAGEGRSLILNGHIDVVSPGDETNWSCPALEGHRQGRHALRTRLRRHEGRPKLRHKRGQGDN